MSDEEPETGTPAPTPLPNVVQTAFVFAARYTHHRKTGGSLAMCHALNHVWPELSDRTKEQIIRESCEATANKLDWQMFRDSKMQFGKPEGDTPC